MFIAQDSPGQVPDFGNPLVDTLLENTFILLSAAVILLGVMGRVISHLVATRKDVAAIRQQTENSHAAAPYPNLRDNLDANQAELLEELRSLKGELREIRAELTHVQADNHRQEKDLGGIRSEVREDRRAHNQLVDRVTQLEAGRTPGYHRSPGFHRKTPTEEDEDEAL